MKNFLRVLLTACTAAVLLSVTAFADFGPKPQLVIRVEHAPETLYYLDILAEGNYEDAASPFDGLEWNYSDEEIAALDQNLLELLRAAVPDGWHACTAEGSTGAPMWGRLLPDEDGLHTFGYLGVPATYRIIIATADGETWISDVYTRRVLQSSVTVSWPDRTVAVPPVWVGYVLQFLSTLLPTLAVEGLLLPAFGFSWRRNWKPFLLVNLITQGALALYFGIRVVQLGFGPWFLLLFIPTELIIALAEAAIYSRRLAGRSRRRAFLYGIAANACSALLGWYLAEPVWRFVVSIS